MGHFCRDPSLCRLLASGHDPFLGLAAMFLRMSADQVGLAVGQRCGAASMVRRGGRVAPAHQHRGLAVHVARTAAGRPAAASLGAALSH